MKYCMNCGKQLPDEAKFCFGCGKEMMPTAGTNNINNGMPVSNGMPMNNGIQVNNPFNYQPVPKPTIDNSIPKAIAIASIVLSVLGTFMPFFVVTFWGTSKSVSLVSENFIILTIVGYVFLIVEFSEVVSNHPKVKRDTIIISVLLFVELILQYCINKGRMHIETEYGSYDLSNALSVGAGFYILIIAGVGLLIAGLIYKE